MVTNLQYLSDWLGILKWHKYGNLLMTGSSHWWLHPHPLCAEADRGVCCTQGIGIHQTASGWRSLAGFFGIPKIDPKTCYLFVRWGLEYDHFARMITTSRRDVTGMFFLGGNYPQMATIFSDVLFIYVNSCISARWDMGMGQYLQIPFLVGWTSIYQLFWGSLGYQGFDSYPYTDNYWYTTNNTQKLDDTVLGKTCACVMAGSLVPVPFSASSRRRTRQVDAHRPAWLDVSRFTRFYRWSSQLENVFKCDKYINK